jgi:DNA topoisomerase-1
MTAIERLQAVGIRRLGSKERGFRYRRAEGGRPSPKDLKRIEGLRIPPAWREVAIHPSARGSVQAVGKDAAGRWQYRYHPASTARRERRKYGRLLKFAEALPRMRRTVSRDLARPGLPREKVLASVLRILSTCFLRPGSQAYAQDNGSFGLATLRRQHVAVEGDQVRFNFPGKAGKRQTCEMRDRRVAWIVRRLVQEPGEVFKYRNGNGLFVDVRRRDINAYIKELMGETFSAKDFRTWAGTLLCACALARAGVAASETRTARRRKLVAAIKETAALLGNTPAVCRSSYIYPSVLHGFERGRVIGRHFHTVEEMLERRASALHASERALLRFLKKKAP